MLQIVSNHCLLGEINCSQDQSPCLVGYFPSQIPIRVTAVLSSHGSDYLLHHQRKENKYKYILLCIPRVLSVHRGTVCNACANNKPFFFKSNLNEREKRSRVLSRFLLHNILGSAMKPTTYFTSLMVPLNNFFYSISDLLR